MLAAIFTELHKETTNVGDRLNNIKAEVDGDDAKRAKKLYGKMLKVSNKLSQSLIGCVHIFDVASNEFKAVSKFEKFEAEFTATLMKEIQASISSKDLSGSKASQGIG